MASRASQSVACFLLETAPKIPYNLAFKFYKTPSLWVPGSDERNIKYCPPIAPGVPGGPKRTFSDQLCREGVPTLPFGSSSEASLRKLMIETINTQSVGSRRNELARKIWGGAPQKATYHFTLVTACHRLHWPWDVQVGTQGD